MLLQRDWDADLKHLLAQRAGYLFLKRKARDDRIISGIIESIENAVDLLAKTAEDTRLGDAHGVGSDAQRGGDLGGALALQNQAPEGTPGRRLELRLNQLQKPARDVAVVFLIPEATKTALGVFQLIEDVGKIAVAGRHRPRMPATPEDAQTIDRDVAQPATEGTRPQIVLKIRQLADEYLHHLLRQIVAVRVGDAVTAQPRADERSV